jgi:hypothetical protein
MNNAMEMALEFIKTHCATSIPALKTIAALEEAIKQQGEPVIEKASDIVDFDDFELGWRERGKNQGEPVGIYHNKTMRCGVEWLTGNPLADGTKLYTSAPTIPEGWQLVPKALDASMRGILANYFEVASKGGVFLFDAFWNALLSAAPKGEAMNYKNQAFKVYVHQRLDAMGVPHSVPESEHDKAGCRIGGRLDYVESDLAALRASLAEALEVSSHLMSAPAYERARRLLLTAENLSA